MGGSFILSEVPLYAPPPRLRRSRGAERRCLQGGGVNLAWGVSFASVLYEKGIQF